MTDKKHEDADRIREQHYKNKEIIAQNKYETESSIKARRRQKEEISIALKESARMGLLAKERLERKKSEIKAKIRESIKKGVIFQLNKKFIEEQRKNYRIKKLQEMLGTEETDLATLEQMHQEMKVQKRIEYEQAEKEAKK